MDIKKLLRPRDDVLELIGIIKHLSKEIDELEEKKKKAREIILKKIDTDCHIVNDDGEIVARKGSYVSKKIDLEMLKHFFKEEIQYDIEDFMASKKVEYFKVI